MNIVAFCVGTLMAIVGLLSMVDQPRGKTRDVIANGAVAATGIGMMITAQFL